MLCGVFVQNESGYEMDCNMLCGVFVQNESGYEMDCNMSCGVVVQNESGYEMDCNMLPLFELSSVQHAQYLLNLRLPNSSDVGSEMKNDLRKLKEISVYVSRLICC